jgi:hypothetical protein
MLLQNPGEVSLLVLAEAFDPVLLAQALECGNALLLKGTLSE